MALGYGVAVSYTRLLAPGTEAVLVLRCLLDRRKWLCGVMASGTDVVAGGCLSLCVYRCLHIEYEAQCSVDLYFFF